MRFIDRSWNGHNNEVGSLEVGGLRSILHMRGFEVGRGHFSRSVKTLLQLRNFCFVDIEPDDLTPPAEGNGDREPYITKSNKRDLSFVFFFVSHNPLRVDFDQNGRTMCFS